MPSSYTIHKGNGIQKHNTKSDDSHFIRALFVYNKQPRVHVLKVFSKTLDSVCLELLSISKLSIISFIIDVEKNTRSDTVVYKLLNYFRWIKLQMAQIACDFVLLIGEIRLLSSSFGLGRHFRKNQNWFSAVSLIFIEPGTSRRMDFSPPRSDISRYAPVFFSFAY